MGVQHQYSSEATPSHPDFQLPWIRNVLSQPGLELILGYLRQDTQQDSNTANPIISSSLFTQTLAHPSGIRASLIFRLPSTSPDSVSEWEHCYLFSIGSGLDGLKGRAHGGLSSLLLDHVTGAIAHHETGEQAIPPVTATMQLDYRAPIDTPGVILARAWPVERSGRKMWVKSVLEDGQGKVFVEAKSLFVKPRITTMMKI